MKNLTFIVLSVVMLLVSCSKDTEQTTGDFTYQLNRDFSPVKVSFATSGNGTAYAWDFGDNGVSASSNPEHLFENPGTYTVKLSISGPSGAKEVTRTINIPAKATIMRVSKLVLKGWAALNPNNSSWDPGSGPDIFYQANYQGSATALLTSNYVTNAITGTNYEFVTTYDITDFTKNVEFKFYDDDSPLNPDFVGGLAFNMNTLRTGANAYPTVFPLTLGSISFDLYVTWIK